MNKQNVTRRNFLQKSAGVAAAAIGFPYIVQSSALGKAGTVAPSNRIVMAAVGVGARGTSNLSEFLGNKGVQVVAICDVDQLHSERARKTVDGNYGNNDCRTYGDFRELFQRRDIDAVILSLPDHWHGITAVEAARTGFDIYGEKPLARTVRQSRAIVDAVKKYGVVWQTGSQQRSMRNMRFACELVRNGRLGKVTKVDVALPQNNRPSPAGAKLPVPAGLDWQMWLGPAPWRPYAEFGIDKDPRQTRCHWNWRWISDYAPGMLSDWGAHHIDIAQWGLGFEYSGPVEIEGKGKYPPDGLYAPRQFDIHCKYSNGVIMRIFNGDYEKTNFKGVIWHGDKGWVKVDRNGIWAEPESLLNEVIGLDEIRLYESREHKQNFLDCVRSRRDTVAPAEIAHRSVSVALIAEIAMLLGRKLDWDPETEKFKNDPEANRLLSRPMRSPWHL